MIKRLIFDIDGTLIRNVNFVDAITKTLTEHHLFTKENLENFLKSIATYENNFKSYTHKTYLEFFSKNFNVTLEEDFLSSFFKNLKEVVPLSSTDEQETLADLSRKYELVLLSNYFEESQRNRLETMGINKYFKEYYGETIIKPYKEAYLLACGEHKPSSCVMIGDHVELDCKIPKELGFHTILFSEESNEYADKTIQNIRELKRIL